MISLDTINYAAHSVTIKESANGYELAIDSNGKITISNSSFAVTASDLDIRNLASSQDNVEIKTAAGQALAIDGSGYLTITNSSFAVTASDLDIRNLASSQDNVEIKTAAGQALAIDASGYLTVNQGGTWSITTVPGGYSDWKVTKEAVDDSPEVELASTPLTGRLMINIQNLGPNEVYLANATGVDTNDFQLPAKSSVEWGLDDSANIFAICDTGKSADLRVAEFKA